MITARIITLSDKGSRGERTDTSGPAAAEILSAKGFEVLGIDILPDEKEPLVQKLKDLSRECDLIVTTGGTGLSPRDITPEATRSVIDKEIPGIAEVMRAEGLSKTNRSMLTRGLAGILGETLIINLPGSEKAVRENLGSVVDVLAHAIDKIKGGDSDCGR